MATSLVVSALILGLLVLANAGELARNMMTDELRLYHYLLEHYKPSVRPVYKIDQTIKVSFGLTLLYINKLTWKDRILHWDITKYNGLDLIRLPADRIWTPDLHIYNAHENVKTKDVLVQVTHDGDVSYITPAQLVTHCSIDARYFPYDTQTCSIKVASWAYDGFKVDIELFDGSEYIDMTGYTKSNEWMILEHPAQRNVVIEPCCVEPYPSLVFSLKIKRQSSYYGYVFIIPAMAISLLIPFMFLLPASSRQKLTLGGFILLSILLLLWMLTDALASVESMRPPLLIMYYLCNLLIVSLSIMMNVFLESVYYNNKDKKPPALLRKIFLVGLGKLVCVCPASPYQPTGPGNIGMSSVQAPGESFSNEPAGGDSSDSAEPCMVPINEWPLICTVLDRLLFLIFLIFPIVICCDFF